MKITGMVLIIIILSLLVISFALFMPKNVEASEGQIKSIRVGNLFFTDGYGVYSYDPITKKFTKISRPKI